MQSTSWDTHEMSRKETKIRIDMSSEWNETRIVGHWKYTRVYERFRSASSEFEQFINVRGRHRSYVLVYTVYRLLLPVQFHMWFFRLRVTYILCEIRKILDFWVDEKPKPKRIDQNQNHTAWHTFTCSRDTADAVHSTDSFCYTYQLRLNLCLFQHAPIS